MPPPTTKRRTTTYLKTKNDHNCQQMELCGCPTTKELKKKHSCRLIGGAERTCGKVAAGGLGGRGGGWWSHICVKINREEQCRSQTDHATQGSSTGKESLKTPGCKNLVAGETPNLTGKFVGGAHGVLGCTQIRRPRNQHQKGPMCWWVVGEVTKSQWRAEQAALFPL